MKHRSRRASCLAALLTAGAASAEPVRTIPDNSPDAAERRTQDSAAGLSVNALATVDLFGDVAGGAKRGFRAPAKFAAAAGYSTGDGWTAVLSAQYVNGSRLSGDLAGDTQGISNIEAPHGLRVYEAWVLREWRRGSVKVGLTDLNADFDQQEVGALFLNSSAGIAAEFSHSGRNGPSIFPNTALAATGTFEPGDGWTLRAGVFDGVPGDPDHPHRFAVKLSGKDGALVIGQVTKRYGNLLRLAGGAWTYTAAFPTFAARPRNLRASHGAYGLIEGRLLGGGDGERLLTGWVRAGIADRRVNRITGYVGGGVTLAAPFGGRAGDDAGLTVMRAGFGAPARRIETGLRRAETTIEATYHASIGGGLALQPDIQYVFNPNGSATVANALVVGVRLTFAVSHLFARQP